jgi:hypothetical protein
MKTQKLILPTKAKWVSKVIGFSLLGIPLMSNLTHAQSLSPAPQIGFRFKQSQEFNMGVISEDKGSGGCHSQSYSRNEIAEQATFISSNMPPAPGLRVAIRNVTPGIDQNPSPYTDREYDKPPTSEGFKVSLGTIHSGRFLAVQPGENHFSYEIKRGNTIIESGTFTARIDHKTQSRERDENLFECQKEYYQQREYYPMREFDPMRGFDPMREFDPVRVFDRQEDKPRRH